jgi:adenylyltransferase/sulfurtransferase
MKSPSCEQNGVLGPLPGLLGVLQAFEVIKLCLQLPHPLIGKLWCWNMTSVREIAFDVSPECPLCTGMESFASLWAMQAHQITAQELFNRLSQKEDIFLLDVRSPAEHQQYNMGGTLIPLDQLPQHLQDIPVDKPIVVICHSGYRSQRALEMLVAAGITAVSNLVGGIVAWQQQVSCGTKTL